VVPRVQGTVVWKDEGDQGTMRAMEDMQLDVFKSLLNFIYTDVLPVFDDDIDDDDYSEMINHLLVAADRYAMERLKLLCASVLAKHLRVETVATTLALADQRNCKSLRDMCIEFMDSSDRMRAVVATQGYANLKRTCPSVIVDVLKKTSRCHKI
jgi:speckle-type POZ protein